MLYHSHWSTREVRRIVSREITLLSAHLLNLNQHM